MTRRRFAFWLGFGLFTLAEKLRMGSLDALAAATMRTAEPSPVGENSLARALERGRKQYVALVRTRDATLTANGSSPESRRRSVKRLASLTRELERYLDPNVVPASVQSVDNEVTAEEIADAKAKYGHRRPHATRVARHGRPPSKWLRSLNADEIRIWLCDNRGARGRRRGHDLLGASHARPSIRRGKNRRPHDRRASRTARRGALRVLT